MALAILLLAGAAISSPAWAMKLLFDDFEDPATLNNYIQLHPEQLTTYEIADGVMRMVPMPGTTFFQAITGPFAYQVFVAGDFVLETSAYVSNTTRPGTPANQSFNFGGLAVRDPASDSGPQNLITFGFGWIVFGNGYRVNSTTDGVVGTGSFFIDTDNAGTVSALLRIARSGDTFSMSFNEGAGWMDAGSVDRPDLPSELQIGMFAIGGGDFSDIIAEFEYIDLTMIPIPAAAWLFASGLALLGWFRRRS